MLQMISNSSDNDNGEIRRLSYMHGVMFDLMITNIADIAVRLLFQVCNACREIEIDL